jgi:hypothetical protein
VTDTDPSTAPDYTDHATLVEALRAARGTGSRTPIWEALRTQMPDMQQRQAHVDRALEVLSRECERENATDPEVLLAVARRLHRVGGTDPEFHAALVAQVGTEHAGLLWRAADLRRLGIERRRTELVTAIIEAHSAVVRAQDALDELTDTPLHDLAFLESGDPRLVPALESAHFAVGMAEELLPEVLSDVTEMLVADTPRALAEPEHGNLEAGCLPCMMQDPAIAAVFTAQAVERMRRATHICGRVVDDDA